jgi:cystathionine gamma-lyase
MAPGDGTRVIHAGLPAAAHGEPLLPGPEFASLYHLSGDPGGGYEYGRYGNRTWSAYEAALGDLEGGRALVFGSGMAAASAILLPLLGPGDVLLAPEDGYPVVRTLAREHLAPRGVEVRFAPSGPAFADAVEDGITLVWAETPSNPGLEVCDLRDVSRRAHVAGALVAVDNTLATPLGQRPLELGADFSMSSDTKYMSGHSDLLLGHVAVDDDGLFERLASWRTTTGAIAGPFETWLAHRSLATLDLRLERQCGTALALAETLAARDDVSAVRYPGRPGDPAHDLAAAQMSRFGAIVVFDLGSRERAERFLALCELVADATSFGGVHSTAERRARWPGNEVGEGFIRMSVGCETPEDLIGDVTRALDRSAAPA